jgi:hypothetical protein
MRYFIRTPKITGDRILGPFGPIETLQKVRKLQEAGIEYFITTEFGVVLGSEDEIRRSET